MKRTKLTPVLFGLIALNLLNLFDAYYTYIGIRDGYLVELNPIMDYLLCISPFYFFACKITLVGLASIFLYLRQTHRLARLVVWFTVVVYSFIAVVHFFHLWRIGDL